VFLKFRLYFQPDFQTSKADLFFPGIYHKIIKMRSAEDIQKYIQDNVETLFYPVIQQLNNTTIGTPFPVYDLHKQQQFWFIPFLLKAKVRGSAIMDMAGKIISHGILTPNIQDEDKLIDKHFFEKVPKKTINEIKHNYKDHTITSQIFSFDRTPQKWGWLICLKKDNSEEPLSIFVGPGGWYERRMGNDFEG